MSASNSFSFGTEVPCESLRDSRSEHLKMEEEVPDLPGKGNPPSIKRSGLIRRHFPAKAETLLYGEFPKS